MRIANKIFAAGAACAVLTTGTQAEDAPKKNVLFIICDDLNDSIAGMGGHPQAVTPNIDRLSKMGVRFTNAHCNAPMCAPSRPGLLSGLYPHSTGMFGGKPKFRTLPALKDAVLFPAYMKQRGYKSYAGGKLFHGTDLDNTVFGASSPTAYDGGFIGPIANFAPYPWDGKTLKWNRPSREVPSSNNPGITKAPWSFGFGRLSNLPTNSTSWVYSDRGFKGEDGKNGGIFKYNGPDDRSLMPDEIIAQWAVNLLKGQPASMLDVSLTEQKTVPIGEDPFFLAVGFIKTHFALYCPDEFYDAVLKANNMSSDDDVLLPWTKDGQIAFGDLDDIPGDLRGDSAGRERYAVIKRAAQTYPGGLKQMLKDITMAYLASVYEIDTQVGKLLDTLEETGRLKDTIIILTSDHGYDHGDKEYFFKFSLWEKSTRIPFVVYDPSPEFDASRGTTCSTPVSLVDVYPTLLDLCDLEPKEGLDGFSIRPLLKDPQAGEWDGPPVALSANGYGDPMDLKTKRFTIRGERYRYTRSGYGSEELYDHQNDPREWTNLAKNPEYAEIKQELKEQLLKMTGQD